MQSTQTKPEIKVQFELARLNVAFKCNDRSLPGSPDLVIENSNIVIFVHGCFWHRHFGCGNSKVPIKNQASWLKRFDETVKRDQRVHTQLTQLGWKSLTYWECEINKNPVVIARRILETTIDFDRNQIVSSR